MRAHLGLGANLGERERTIEAACRAIAALPDTRIAVAASLYRTSPVGFPNQPDFINTVIAVDTMLAPPAFVRALKEVERDLGRRPRPRWHEREIDIDVLTYGDEKVAFDDVVIPHPQLALRRFVLVPLAEIAPGLVPAGHPHPVAELLRRCPDTGSVEQAGPPCGKETRTP